MLNAIFVSTLGCLIIIANVMMGCQLNLEVVGSTLKRPVAPGIGFACQFLLMPTISYVLAKALLLPYGLYSLALGLFTVGCAPGGGGSNFWTVLLDGNADLSITMTFISTLAALVMMPAWMWALGGEFVAGLRHPGAAIRIPYKNIVLSLAILVGPLLVGIAVRRFIPKAADLIRRVTLPSFPFGIAHHWLYQIMRPFLIFILLFIITFGTYANLYMFKLMSWQVIFPSCHLDKQSRVGWVEVLTGGLLLPFIGFWLGCFAALAFRMPKEDVAAIAIETGVQNSGIAIMLLKVP